MFLAFFSCVTTADNYASDDSTEGQTPDDSALSVIERKPDTQKDMDSSAPSGPDALLVISANLACLRHETSAFPDNAARLQALAEAIGDLGADVVALQEACRTESEDAQHTLQLALQEVTGETWSGTWVFAHSAWEGTDDEAEEGVGLLLRGEIAEEMAWTFTAQDALTRVMLGVRRTDGVVVFSAHLEAFNNDTRRNQARELASVALAWAGDTGLVLAGDLNDTAGSQPLETLEHAGFLSTGSDVGLIDHVLIQGGGGWETLDSAKLFESGIISDHPIIGTWLESAPAEIVYTGFLAWADVGWGHHMTLRGESGSLSWEEGWVGLSDEGVWCWGITGLEAGEATEYKLLMDDSEWQLGDNQIAVGGENNETTPVFNLDLRHYVQY